MKSFAAWTNHKRPRRLKLWFTGACVNEVPVEDSDSVEVVEELTNRMAALTARHDPNDPFGVGNTLDAVTEE